MRATHIYDLRQRPPAVPVEEVQIYVENELVPFSEFTAYTDNTETMRLLSHGNNDGSSIYSPEWAVGRDPHQGERVSARIGVLRIVDDNAFIETLNGEPGERIRRIQHGGKLDSKAFRECFNRPGAPKNKEKAAACRKEQTTEYDTKIIQEGIDRANEAARNERGEMF